MANLKTSIEWTEATWSPVTGCSKTSLGCKNCYAERLFPRAYPGRKFTDVQTHPNRLRQPLSWRKPKRIFVNSMSDLFHEDIPEEFIVEVFAVMACSSIHTFQVLTKRPTRMREVLSHPDFPNKIASAIEVADWYGMYNVRDYDLMAASVIRNRQVWPLPEVWLGVSVENQETADERIPLLLQTPAAVRFLSCEPLLGPVDLSKWLGGNSQYDLDREDRRLSLSGSSGRSDRSEAGWECLENSRREARPMGQSPQKKNSDASPDRRDPVGWVSTRKNHAPGEASNDGGSSSSLPGFSRSDSSGADNQSQELQWRQGGQSTREPRDSDIRRSSEARNDNLGQETEAPERRTQQDGEVDRTSSAGDSSSSLTGPEAKINSDGFRSKRPNHIKDSAKSALAISWTIIGGESGPKARPMHVAWARSLVEQCKTAGVSCFMKQLGSFPVMSKQDWESTSTRRLLSAKNDPHAPAGTVAFAIGDYKGGTPEEWPIELRVREYPNIQGIAK